MANMLTESGKPNLAERGMRRMIQICGEKDQSDYQAAYTLQALALALLAIGGENRKKEAAPILQQLLDETRDLNDGSLDEEVSTP